MLIGRSEDPHNPRRVAASKVSHPFGSGSWNPSGPAAAGRETQAGHTTATAPHRKFFFPTPLHQPGRPHTPYGRWKAMPRTGCSIPVSWGQIFTPDPGTPGGTGAKRLFKRLQRLEDEADLGWLACRPDE
jgi:hypothetical protein